MPAKLIDITGKRFKRLVVLSRAERNASNGDSLWRCRCDCGKEFEASGPSIRRGRITACGCQQFVANLRHGRHRDPVYRIWRNMVARCDFTNHAAYPNYGGRGIKVCDRWRESIEAFAADMGPRPDGMTIERIDNAGDYEPGNCRWATPLEQGNNKRTNVSATIDGKTQTVAEWCREFGMDYRGVMARIRRGESVAQALSRPVRKNKVRSP